MADTNDFNKASRGVKESIDELSSNMKKLVAAQMAQLVKGSSDFSDNMESANDILQKMFNLEDKTTRQLREQNKLEEFQIKLEEKQLKLRKQAEASKNAEVNFEKKLKELKEKNLDTEEKLVEEINKLRKEGLDIDEDEIDSQEELISFLEKRKGILERNSKILEHQSELLNKQVDYYKKHGALANILHKKLGDIKKSLSFENLLNKTISLTESWLGQLSHIASFGALFNRLKEDSKSYTDAMWSMNVNIDYATSGLLNFTKTIYEYDEAIKQARITATKFGEDPDRVSDMIAQLSAKVRFVKKELREIDGKEVTVNKFDAEKASKVTENLIAFSKIMRMDVSEAIDMYTDNIRKFGMDSEKAMNILSDVQAQTRTFNELLGEDAVFANEVGEAFREVQQDTRYWVQDLMMMNTQFNVFINSLIKQGKSQKEALSLAQGFQKLITGENDTALTTYNVGDQLAKKYDKAVKEARKKAKKEGKSQEEREKLEMEAGAKALGLDLTNEAQMSKARTTYKTVVKDKAFRTQKGIADYFAQAYGGTSTGMEERFKHWDRRINQEGWGLEVAQSQGFGRNNDEAAEFKVLLDEMKARGLGKEGFDFKSQLSQIVKESIEKELGGIDDAGNASAKLLESFNKLSEEEKKRYKGETAEQKAVDYFNKKVSEKMEALEKNTEKNSLESTVENADEKLGNINTKIKDIAEHLTSLKYLVPLALGLTALKTLPGALKTVAWMGKGFAKGGGKLLTKVKGSGKIIPPSVKVSTPKGSVGNASRNFKKGMSFDEFKKANPNMGGNRDFKRAEWRNAQKELASVSKSAGKDAVKASVEQALKKSSSKVVTEAVGKAVAKEAGEGVLKLVGKSAAKSASKKIPVGGIAAGLTFAGMRAAEGDYIGAGLEAASGAASAIPGIGTIASGAIDVALLAKDIVGSFIGSNKGTLKDEKVQNDLYFEMVKTLPKEALTFENINDSIDAFVNEIGKNEGVTADDMAELKKSFRENYNSSQNKIANGEKLTTSSDMILNKKMEDYDKEQIALMQEQQRQEKEAYEQLDDLGKLLATQEKMYKMHEKWFNFAVQNEVRSIMDDPNLSEKQKLSRLNGIGNSRRIGYGMLKEAVDASGVVTWKVYGNQVKNATIDGNIEGGSPF